MTDQLLEVPAEKLTGDPVILKGKAECYIDFEIDMREVREHMGEEKWAAYPLDKGFQEWERGSVIAWDIVNDSLELDLYGKGIKVKWSDISDINLPWTKELAEQLNLFPKDDAAVAAKVDN